MRRFGLNIAVSVAAVGLGVVAFVRGQTTLGFCFLGLGILRALAVLASRKPGKIKPEIKLGLDDSDDSPETAVKK